MKLLSGHADTIRRIRNQLPADVARDFDALLAENQRLQEDAEKSLVEWQRVENEAVTAMNERDELSRENQRLREALEWYADSPSPGLRERAEKALAGDAE